MPEADFIALAEKRAAQGFTAVQLVAGLPPEVGPENVNGHSPVGPPWTLDGAINGEYLAFARERIQALNELGLRVIVYGAWGHQIAWLGVDGITAWWRALIDALDDLDVVYCLSGESNLWVDMPNILLPDRTTTDLPVGGARLWLERLPWRLQKAAHTLVKRLRQPRVQRRLQARQQQWSAVLAQVAPQTKRPFLIHTYPGETSDEVVTRPDLLAATTVQTGHSQKRRRDLWRLPLSHAGRERKPFINLEPWYEGILGRFGPADQLFAYWASMLAGASSFCYGAHGIWNAGDGRFLAHWGKQTWAQAAALDTPRLLGLSHRLLRQARAALPRGQVFHEAAAGDLRVIGVRQGEKRIAFYPDVGHKRPTENGRIWLPLAGEFTKELPAAGPIVTISL